MDTAHHEPNYMNIFWALTILTIVEVLVPVLGVFSRPVNGTILVLLAVAKALLVALYFMHLRFERTTLGVIALTPMIICVFLILMLLPDLTDEGRTYTPPDRPAVSTAEH